MTKGTNRERAALFTPAFLEDLRWWVKSPTTQAPRASAWSRRITQEHRLVYSAGAGWIDFLRARYHY